MVEMTCKPPAKPGGAPRLTSGRPFIEIVDASFQNMSNDRNMAPKSSKSSAYIDLPHLWP